MTAALDVVNQPALLLTRVPADLRRRIYLHIGVARWDGRPYTYYLGESTVVKLSWEPPPASTLGGLLLSCRTLYTEVAALLYSANHFVIHYTQPGSLSPLRALTPSSLASLTRLKIVLNESSCHQPDTHSLDFTAECCFNPPRHGLLCHEYHGRTHRPPLISPPWGDPEPTELTTAQVMLSEWHATAAYLSSHIGTGRLHLSLVCDVDPELGQKAARLAVAPLTSLPLLQSCHIRLGKQRNPPLQQLATDAVLGVSGSAKPAYARPGAASSAPALAGLPRELRHRVLEYTDLITPWKEVSWSRQDHGYLVHQPHCHLPYPHGCPADMHHGCQLSTCCGPSSSGCFCRRRHAAFSPACRCWAPPTDLFLVCRSLCRDAQFVFFSGNRFIVHDFHVDSPWDLPPAVVQRQQQPQDYPFDCFAASEFLRDIVPVHCLADLRFLELVFPPYPPGSWPRAEHASVLDWRATVDWLRPRIDAPALVMRLVMADFWYVEEAERDGADRQRLSRQDGLAIVHGYIRILDPLKALVATEEDGLAGFYVQPAHPWRWTRGTWRQVERHGREWLDSVAQDLKDRCERFVRGHGSARSWRYGRPEPPSSLWQRLYDADPYGWY